MAKIAKPATDKERIAVLEKQLNAARAEAREQRERAARMQREVWSGHAKVEKSKEGVLLLGRAFAAFADAWGEDVSNQVPF